MVRLLHEAGVVRASFDDPNLMSYVSLEPVMRLAESCDLHGIVAERLHVPTDKGANASGKGLSDCLCNRLMWTN